MPTYKNYAVIAPYKTSRASFDNNINKWLAKDTAKENANIRAYYPDRIVTASSEDSLLSIPNMRFYQLTNDEAIALSFTSSVKSVPRHFSQEETLVKYDGLPTSSFSSSLNLFMKSGSPYPDFDALSQEEYDPTFTGSISECRLFIPAMIYSSSQESFWYNGGEEILANSSSYSQSFLDKFIKESMSWNNSIPNSSSEKVPDGNNYIGLEIDGLLTPWYMESKPATDNINGVTTNFGGGGLGFYNMAPTVNQRWRNSSAGESTSYYSGDWPGSQTDTTGQMINWGLYAHSTPKEEFDWRIMYQLDTNSASIDEYGNFPLKSTSVPYNFTATGENIDLIIMDTGVNTQNPEFKYYDPNFFPGIAGGWVSRVIKTDWTNYCPEISNNYGLGGNFISQYYDNLFYEHGTMVASNAAGRTQGWAKEARIHDIRIFGNPCLTTPQAFQCVLNFHVSKSINPTTGFKDPTVVNMSWGYYSEPINLSQWYLPDGKTLFDWSPASDIKEIYYKGVNLYPNYTGSLDDAGNLRYNLMPGPDQGMRFIVSESFSTSYYKDSIRKIFKAKVSATVGVIEELQQECVDAGVIFISAAHNNGQLVVKSGSKYEGVDYDDRGLWESFFVKGTQYTDDQSFYINRAPTSSRNNATINVGALAPNIVIDRGTDLLTGSLKTSGSRAYDVYGERAGCNYVFGGAGSYRFIRNPSFEHLGYSIPFFEHSDMQQIMGTQYRVAKKGSGVGNTFPGWENANSSSYFPPAYFSNIGNGVDIWAAGHNIPVARHDLSQIVALVTGYTFAPYKTAYSSLAYWQKPFQTAYYFLGNPDYGASL